MERIRNKHKEELKVFSNQKDQIRRLWNIDDKSAEMLYTLIRIKQPKLMVEIGTSNGFSSFWNSIACEKSKTEYHTVEVNKSRYQLALENLKSRNNINFHFGLAEDIIPNLPDNIEFAFIDAGKIGYINYLNLLLPKLADQAVLVADNVVSHAHTVDEYLQVVRNDKRFESMTLDIDAGFEISIFNK